MLRKSHLLKKYRMNKKKSLNQLLLLLSIRYPLKKNNEVKMKENVDVLSIKYRKHHVQLVGIHFDKWCDMNIKIPTFRTLFIFR